jgi:indole-3-glycerol phosphate synthase / phosphoribosylanthranilate isomerase
MPSILSEIIENKRTELAERRNHQPLTSLTSKVGPTDGRFARALQGDGIKLITEIKPSSPSAGDMKVDLDLDQVLSVYNKHASAISVLTDKQYFKGSLELMQSTAHKSPHPVLCKDFIIDEYQVYEARLHGAEGVLLIIKILDPEQYFELYKSIHALGMTAVVEVQNEGELAIAMETNPEVILINNRNLSTFQIDFNTTKQLARLIPPEVLTISASGIESRKDIDDLLPFATRFLIGSTLMKSDNMERKLEELING